MKKIIGICIVSLFILVSFSVESVNIPNDSETNKSVNIPNDSVTNNELRPVMKVDYQILEKWKEEYNNVDNAYINPKLEAKIQTTSNFSILEYLNYVPDERDQGRCSNCWAWPSTGVMAIALFIQEGIFERLSVQYINSCGEDHGGVGCCEAGSLEVFVDFYKDYRVRKAIPWSNDNADWQDGNGLCLIPCEIISTEPNYPIDKIKIYNIETHNISEEEAIFNIKNILHQDKGIYFSWYLPNMAYRLDFGNFWRNNYEDYMYNLDWDCGAEFIEGEGGGHGVLCIGYNDEEGEVNDYWIMLNSWGATNRRPNGLFAVNMHMDYDCTILYEENEYFSFNFRTLNITFGSGEEAPQPPIIQGPTTGQVGTDYIYTISAIDNQEDDVFFSIDWDDEEIEEWIGPVASGEQLEVNHTWDKRGEYVIKVKAKDITGAESLTSLLEVSMPKIKALNPVFSRVFERVPLLVRLLYL